MNKMIKRIGCAVAGSFAVTQMASAAIDTSSVTTALTEAATAVGVVGAAVLVVVVGTKVFKFIRAAM